VKVALLADIHANHLALNSVLNAASRSGVDSLLIAGDCVGYYFEPLQVLNMIQCWEHTAVRGNHEEMLAHAAQDHDYLITVTKRYGTGIWEAIKQLSQRQLDSICSLPHTLEQEIDGRNILLCHGAPDDIDCYLYPDSDLNELNSASLAKYDLVVTGHTHYPMQRILSDKTMLINPGAVGQPRNRQPGAHWALYDTASGDVSFRCEKYDYSQLQLEAEKRHPELPYLAEILGRT